MTWRKATLTTKSGTATYATRCHTETGLHILKWHNGYILMSADCVTVARFRLARGARSWAEEYGPKNPHGWTTDGVQEWRKSDPAMCESVFAPLIALGEYHLH